MVWINTVRLTRGLLPEYVSCGVYEHDGDNTWVDMAGMQYASHLVELRYARVGYVSSSRRHHVGVCFIDHTPNVT